MTCIIGFASKGDVWIGADSAVSDGWSKDQLATPKVFVKDEFIIGVTGTIRSINLLTHRLNVEKKDNWVSDELYINTVFVDSIRALFKEHGHASTKDNQDSTEDTLVVGYHGSLYVIESNFQVVQYSDSFACAGIGEQYAKGAMEALKLPPRQRIKRALEVSAKFSMGVSAPFVISCLKKNGAVDTWKTG